eukprot:1735451-Prymnesium_polylepis.1
MPPYNQSEPPNATAVCCHLRGNGLPDGTTPTATETPETGSHTSTSFLNWKPLEAPAVRTTKEPSGPTAAPARGESEGSGGRCGRLRPSSLITDMHRRQAIRALERSTRPSKRCSKMAAQRRQSSRRTLAHCEHAAAAAGKLEIAIEERM